MSTAIGNSGNYGGPLDLYQQFRAGETGDGNQRARRKIVAKDLLSQLGKSVAKSRIGNKDRHCHHISEGAAGFLDGVAKPGKYLANLAVKITRERSAGGICSSDLPCQLNGPAALGDDRLRIGTCLCNFPLYVAPDRPSTGDAFARYRLPKRSAIAKKIPSKLTAEIDRPGSRSPACLSEIRTSHIGRWAGLPRVNIGRYGRLRADQ
jgi:hypothetical protein